MHVTDPEQILGRTVVDEHGERIGTVAELYLDEQADRAGWLAVTTGLFGQHVSLVPLTAAAWSGDAVAVPFAKRHVSDAPHHDPQMALSREEEAALFDHYGLPYGDRATVAVTGAPGEVPTTADYTTEDTGAGVREGAGQASRTRLRRVVPGSASAAAAASTASTPVAAAGDPAGDPAADPAGLDVSPVAVYPDDIAAEQVAREHAERARAARERAARGL